MSVDSVKSGPLKLIGQFCRDVTGCKQWLVSLISFDPYIVNQASSSVLFIIRQQVVPMVLVVVDICREAFSLNSASCQLYVPLIFISNTLAQLAYIIL